MVLLYSLFFAAGLAGFVFSKFSRRTGYGNEKSIATLVGITFVMAFIVFYTLMKVVFHID